MYEKIKENCMKTTTIQSARSKDSENGEMGHIDSLDFSVKLLHFYFSYAI